MIHVDTGFLIRALSHGSAEDRRLRRWRKVNRSASAPSAGPNFSVVRSPVILLLFIAFSGCAQTVDQAPPASASGGPDDLRGTWTGTWGGAPVQLVIVEQIELGERSGIYFGPVQVFGRRRPGIAGVLTSTIAGAPVSANAEGWLGNVGGRLTLLLHATTTAGLQQVTLARTAADRWTGRGESEFSWGPQGPIEIVRQKVPPVAGTTQ